MVNKVSGGGAIDGQLGINPDWPNISCPNGRTLQSVSMSGAIEFWTVEDAQKTGGQLLADGNYANPTSIAGNSLDNSNLIKSLLIAQGLSGNYGFFADGFTYNVVGDVGIDVDGKIYTYVGNGTLPVTVAPETDPVGNSDYKLFDIKSFNAITTQDLIVIDSYVGCIYEVSGYYELGDGGVSKYLNRGAGWPQVADGYVNHGNSRGEFLELVHNNELSASSCGVISKTLTEDRSANLQAAINATGISCVVIDSDAYIANSITLKTGVDISCKAKIIYDENLSGAALLVASSVRQDTSLKLDVISRHMVGKDRHSHVQTDMIGVAVKPAVYAEDCRGLSISGEIVGVYTKPISISTTGYGYRIEDITLWGSNIVDTVNTSEANTLDSNRYTFGVFAKCFDSAMSEVTIAGYNCGALVRGDWHINNCHFWEIHATQVYGFIPIGSSNRVNNLYCGANPLDGRDGAGVYEPEDSDFPSLAIFTASNTYSNLRVYLENGNTQSHAFEGGDEVNKYSSIWTSINGLTISPGVTLDASSNSDPRVQRIKLKGFAKNENSSILYRGVTKQIAVTHMQSSVVPTSMTTLPNLVFWVSDNVIGAHNKLVVTAEPNSHFHTIFTQYDASETLIVEFESQKGYQDDDNMIVKVSVETVSSKSITEKYTYNYNYNTKSATYISNETKQPILFGVTADRPANAPNGLQFFDVTLNKPIWKTGGGWVDSTGTVV